MTDGNAIELFDQFTWEARSKIITRDVHGISGLMNFTYFNYLTAEPSTSMHFHSGILEIHCLSKGRSILRLYKDGHVRTITCTGGEALVVFPGEYHARGDESRQEPSEIYAMQLDLREEQDFLGLNPAIGSNLCRLLKAYPHRLVKIDGDVLSLLRRAFILFSTQCEDDKYAGVAYLVCFLYQFLKMQPVDMPTSEGHDDRIHRAIVYLTQNISEAMSLSALAKVADYSLSRFKTRFREVTGVTPAHYINICKVERAKEDLIHTDLPITEIGCNLGWSSGNYFCTVFKKLTGFSPLQYRRHYKE